MRALIVPDIDGDPGGEPGAIEFRAMYRTGEIAGLGFRCPCGCGREGYLPFAGIERDVPGAPEWEWDGNQLTPTLSPSVLQVGGCRWHGWLRNGEWEVA